MGCNFSTTPHHRNSDLWKLDQEAKRNLEIEAKLEEAQYHRGANIDLLLIGTGDSGKTSKKY